MVRQLRIQYPGAYYHVTALGNVRKDIYMDHRDYVKIKDLTPSFLLF